MGDHLQMFRADMQAHLGFAPEQIEPGKMQRFGTSNKRGDTAGWCKLFEDLRAGVYGCHRQGVSETWTAADRRLMTAAERAALARQVHAAAVEREAQQRQQWTVNERRNAELWACCMPILPGDFCSLYLTRRGFGEVWPLPEVLRLHRALPYWHEGRCLGMFPAMVAPLVAPDGRTVALHRTYLTADGKKADVPTVKKLTGAAGSLAGACIPLRKSARGCIAIAEGIETALAAWCASSVPTVAAYCAGSMAAYVWPAGVQRLVVFADADDAGVGAAETLRARALAARLRCEVLTPTEPGADWCDVWAARDAVVIKGAAL